MGADLVQRFERNTAGRDFAVGDIHGCFDALCEQMDRVKFDPAVDRIFSVGDLVDRGQQSRDAVNWLGQPWFHAVRGNHEQMAIDWAVGSRAMPADSYEAQGGRWFIDLPQAVQQAVAQAFLTMPVAIEVDTAAGRIGLVHAEPYGNDWGQFTAALESGDSYVADLAMWSRTRIRIKDATPVAGVAAVYVGHTPLEARQTLGNVHYIDTGAVFGFGLTMVQIAGAGLDLPAEQGVATHGN